MNQQELMSFEDKYNEEIKKVMVALPFELPLSELYIISARRLLDNTTISELICSAEEFTILVRELWGSKAPELNYYQFAQINNVLQTKTANQLEIGTYKYCDLVTEAGALAAKWNEVAKPISVELLKKLQNQGKENVANDLKTKGAFGNLRKIEA